MSNVQSPKFEIEEDFDSAGFPIIDGELLEISADEKIAETQDSKLKIQTSKIEDRQPQTEHQNHQSLILYIFAPLIFLTVALLGGLRLSGGANDFLFVRPALVCLVFAAVLLILFFRARLIRLDGWFSEKFALVRNLANAAVLAALFAASVQLFNALLPERGLPLWIVGFCFFWTLWNNLFAEFDTKKLIKSLGAMFALAFVVKYLILANLTAPTSESWLQSLIKNPTQEVLTWALDLPRFSAGTGYIQFFTLAFYFIGLFLLPSKLDRTDT